MSSRNRYFKDSATPLSDACKTAAGDCEDGEEDREGVQTLAGPGILLLA